MKKALIVDDFRTQRTFTRMVISKMSLKVFEAANGKEALEVIQKEYPDVVVTDLEMPQMDGIEMTRAIREKLHMRHLPIIMITSKYEYKATARNAGITHWVEKPFEEKQLHELIHQSVPGLNLDRSDFNILLVDDVQMQTKIWARTLNMEGLNFIHAKSAREGLHKLRNNDIDMIITDYLMPEVDGMRFIKKVKSLPEFHNIPIFIVSEDDDIQRAEELPEVEHTFKKPFNPAELKRMMRQYLDY